MTSGVVRLKKGKWQWFFYPPGVPCAKQKVCKVRAKLGWVGLLILVMLSTIPVWASEGVNQSRQEDAGTEVHSYRDRNGGNQKKTEREHSGTVMALDKLYQLRKYEAVIALGLKILTVNPDHPECNLLVGRALADQLRYREAISYLKKANVAVAGRSWIRGRALECLGRCYFATGNPEAAKAKLNECLALKASKNSVADALASLKLFGFDDIFQGWQTVESEHFIFHFQQPSGLRNPAGFVRAREQEFMEINRNFDTQLPKKIDAFIYNSSEDLQKNAVVKPGFEGEAFSQYCVTHQWLTAAKHEMVHIITYYYGKPQRKSNLINEGIAEYYSKLACCTMEYINLAAKKEKVDAISIRNLWNDWNAYPAALSYPLAGALVDYLIKNGGFDKFSRLLKDPTWENGKEIYGAQLERLALDFERQVNRYLASHPALLNEVKVLQAYWKEELSAKDLLSSKAKNHSFFIAVDFPVEQVGREVLEAFLNQAGFGLELVAEGKNHLTAKVYECIGYHLDDQSYSGFWLSISELEFQKMEPGVAYRLAAKNTGGERRWVIGEQVELIRPQ